MRVLSEQYDHRNTISVNKLKYIFVVLTNTCDITQLVYTRITENCSKIVLKIALKSIAAIISIHRIIVVGRSSYIILCVLGSILPRRCLIQVYSTFFGNIFFSLNSVEWNLICQLGTTFMYCVHLLLFEKCVVIFV